MQHVLTDLSGERFTPQYVKDERLRKRQEAIARLRKTVISCDLGRNIDRSVVCGLDCTPESIHVGNIEAYVRQDYNSLADRLLQIRAAVPDALLVFDATGVGQGVLDLFLARGLRPDLAVIITSGTQVHFGRDVTGVPKMNIPKADLVGYIIRVLNEGRIHINPNAAGAALLQNELQQFQAVVRSTGHIAYSAPAGKHDDAVMSLAVGVAGYARIARQLQRPSASMRRLY